VWESHVTWGTPVQSFVFLGLLVFELEPMYATSDGHTDGRTTDADHRIMPPRRGHNNSNIIRMRWWYVLQANVRQRLNKTCVKTAINTRLKQINRTINAIKEINRLTAVY